MDDDSQEEDLHKKSNLFDTSKDRVEGQNNGKLDLQESDEEDFDLGFGSEKKGGKSLNKSGGGEFDGEFDGEMGMMSEEDDVEENSKAITE